MLFLNFYMASSNNQSLNVEYFSGSDKNISPCETSLDKLHSL